MWLWCPNLNCRASRRRASLGHRSRTLVAGVNYSYTYQVSTFAYPTTQAELQPNCRAANESMGPKAVCIYEGDALACTLRVLRAGCAYRLRVRAFNKAGCGPWCPAVDFSSGTDVPDSTSEVEVLGAGSVSDHTIMHITRLLLEMQI